MTNLERMALDLIRQAYRQAVREKGLGHEADTGVSMTAVEQAGGKATPPTDTFEVQVFIEQNAHWALEGIIKGIDQAKLSMFDAAKRHPHYHWRVINSHGAVMYVKMATEGRTEPQFIIQAF